MTQGQLRYPTLAEVIAIHEKVLRGLGEAPRPLCEEGLLESALTRPQMAAYYEGADLIRQATLLGAGISQAQAFRDGNKRTAFATLDAFLWVNGWEFVGEPLELARRFEQLAESSSEPEAAIDAFEAWLRPSSNHARSGDRLSTLMHHGSAIQPLAGAGKTKRTKWNNA